MQQSWANRWTAPLALANRDYLEAQYRRFLADREKDPSGYETLRELLGERDMTAFQKKWETFVLKLRFR